jgi:small subunit ribosomal protein S8
MTDPIADMLTRIRNALAVNKPEVILPFSKIKFEIGKILESHGYIEKNELITPELSKNEGQFDALKIILKYSDNKEPAIRSLVRISKPGQRVYAAKENLPKVLGGMGIAIISTSQGLMTDKEARKRKLGGEILCEIY